MSGRANGNARESCDGTSVEAEHDWRAVIENRGNVDWQTRLFVALERARVAVVIGTGRRRAKSPTLPGTLRPSLDRLSPPSE
jgi:hypothetical protein